jgi:ribosome biogenesis SPOUT family RNA methylase Rps3
MRSLAGQDAQIYFTHLSGISKESLSTIFEIPDESSSAKVSCFTQGVHEMIVRSFDRISLDKVCLLDPKADSDLLPEDGDGRFQWFLFGVSGPAVKLTNHLM